MAVSKIKGNYEMKELFRDSFSGGSAHNYQTLSESIKNFEYIVAALFPNNRGDASEVMIPTPLFTAGQLISWHAQNGDINANEWIAYQGDTLIQVAQSNVNTPYTVAVWGYKRVQSST